MAELFQKTSGPSVTNLEVNNCRNGNVSDACNEMPFMFSVDHGLLHAFACLNLLHPHLQPIPAVSSLPSPPQAIWQSSSLSQVLCCSSACLFHFSLLIGLHLHFHELGHLAIFPRPNHTFLIPFLMFLIRPLPLHLKHNPSTLRTHLSGPGLRVLNS